MKPNIEKKVKPLKKIKALEKQNEIDAQMVKPAVRIQELKNKLIILGHELKEQGLITFEKLSIKDNHELLNNLEILGM